MTMRCAKSKRAIVRLLINLGIEAYEANPKFQKQLLTERNKEKALEAQRQKENRKFSES